MTSFLDFDAHNDDSHIVKQRVASRVAHKRVADRYTAFMANATPGDRAARLALIEDDVRAVVASVYAEQGVDVSSDALADAILRQLTSGADHLKEFQFKKKDDKGDDKKSESAGDDEKEESDDSDESDDEGDGNPFKEASRKEARRPKMCPYHSEVVDVSLGAGDPRAGYDAMATHSWGTNHCKGGYDGSCNFKPAMVTQQYWDDKQAEYAQRAEQRAVPSLDGTEPIMNPEPFPDAPGEGVTDIEAELAEAPSAVGTASMEMALAHTAADAPSGAGGTAVREKLPKGDESALGGPSPKIDKGTWNGLKPIDTEQSGTKNPTVQQDVSDKAKYDKKDFLDQADTKIKQESLPANSGDAGFDDGGVTDDGYSTDTWTEDNGADPITRSTQSSRDLANPLSEIIESGYGGFLPSLDVDSALHDYDG